MAGKVIQGLFLSIRPKTLSLNPPPPPTTFARPAEPLPPTFGRSHGTLQRHGGTDGSFPVEPMQIGLSAGGGRPLPELVRGKMEAALGADFSGVRVYVGPQAERIGAIAFTVGSDIYFAPGRFQPATARGLELLGHELAHVVQQRQGRVRNPLGSALAVVQDRALEAEADRLGRQAAMHQAPAPHAPVQAKTAMRAVQPASPVRFAAPVAAVLKNDHRGQAEFKRHRYPQLQAPIGRTLAGAAQRWEGPSRKAGVPIAGPTGRTIQRAFQSSAEANAHMQQQQQQQQQQLQQLMQWQQQQAQQQQPQPQPQQQIVATPNPKTADLSKVSVAVNGLHDYNDIATLAVAEREDGTFAIYTQRGYSATTQCADILEKYGIGAKIDYVQADKETQFNMHAEMLAISEWLAGNHKKPARIGASRGVCKYCNAILSSLKITVYNVEDNVPTNWCNPYWYNDKETPSGVEVPKQYRKKGINY